MYVPGATLVVFQEKLIEGFVVLLPTILAIIPFDKPLGIIEILSPSKSLGFILNTHLFKTMHLLTPKVKLLLNMIEKIT